MLCRSLSIVNTHDAGAVAITLECRAWNCEHCQPKRKAQLIDLAVAGTPNRLVTITCSPAVGISPADRAAKLARAWRVTVARARRQLGLHSIQYLAVFEATKRGEPHLHILCRCGFIPQRWLSKQMASILKSPIVDIRLIKHAKVAAKYVAKYIGKAPHRFATCKRYWHTRDWVAAPPPEKETERWEAGRWVVDKRSVADIFNEWAWDGFRPLRSGPDVIYHGTPPPWATNNPKPDACTWQSIVGNDLAARLTLAYGLDPD